VRLAVLVLASLASSVAGAAGPVVYAVVVANNQTFDNSRQPLRFADDDGARYAELFGLTAERIALLAVLDEDTQRVFPDAVSASRAPDRAQLLATLEDTFARIREERAAGKEVVFYFVFSGHGEVSEDSEGYVHLLDGPWTRGDLFEHVIAASPANVNHVLIDACNAYFMVARRGGGQAEDAGDFKNLIRDFLDHESLAVHPDTGVFLSTSSANEVHEWGRIEAGIFSHVIRSALSGAADANGDGAVDYDEVNAYIAAANGDLPDRKTRLEVYARPPAQNLREPLARIPERGARVHIPAHWAGRYYLEDDRGVRFADFNKTAEVSLDLRLVPRPRYYLRSDNEEYVVEPASATSSIRIEDIPAQPLTLAARGSVNDAFAQHLFAIPFGPQFVTGYKQASFSATTPLEVHASPTSKLEPWKWASAAVAGGLAVTSGTLEILSRSAASDYRNGAGSSADLAMTQGRAESLHQAALVTGGIALTAAVTYGVLFWLDDSP